MQEAENKKQERPEKENKRPAPTLFSITALGKTHGVLDWELAGLIRFNRWLPGKSVSDKEFTDALETYRTKKLGE